jgi:hypothetical protein
LPVASSVKLTVYNALGQQVSVLLDEHRAAGFQEVDFDASSLDGGLYYYQIETADFQISKKMMLAG